MIKSKPCTVDGCSQPRWAKGFCKRHQSLRTDGKKPKPIKARSVAGQKKIELKKDLYPNDMAFYFKIWMKRAHVCYNCGCDLGNKPLTLYFDHILEKGTEKYAHLRYEEDNICLLCWDCHTNKALLPKLVALREKTKEKYGFNSDGCVQHRGEQEGRVSKTNIDVSEGLSEL